MRGAADMQSLTGLSLPAGQLNCNAHRPGKALSQCAIRNINAKHTCANVQQPCKATMSSWMKEKKEKKKREEAHDII